MSAPGITEEARTSYQKFATAHKALRRQLERIIELAPFIEPKQQKNFTIYCRAFLDFLHEHHAIEDNIFFPMIKDNCGCEAEVAKMSAEHDVLEPAIHKYEAAVKMQPFNGSEVEAAAVALKEVMYPHLALEEQLFTVEVLNRATVSILNESEKQILAFVKKGNPFMILPCIITHLTKEESEFMILGTAPWILKKVLYPWVFARKHRAAWALAPKPDTFYMEAAVTTGAVGKDAS